MPIINIPFNAPINISAQVGDMVYAVGTASTGGAIDSFEKGSLSNALELGWIFNIVNQEGLDTSVSPTLQVVQTSSNLPQQNSTTGTWDYIMFSKNKAVNTPGILGYYAEVTFKNYSLRDIELFSVGAGIAISSS